MRATCPAHLTLIDLITITIFGEEYGTHVTKKIVGKMISILNRSDIMAEQADIVSLQAPCTHVLSGS
jgi:hypothetical protein